MSNNFFPSDAKKTRLSDIAGLKRDMKTHTQQFDVQQAALEILDKKSLETQAASNFVCLTLTGKECQALIRYHNIVPKALAKDKLVQ